MLNMRNCTIDVNIECAIAHTFFANLIACATQLSSHKHEAEEHAHYELQEMRSTSSVENNMVAVDQVLRRLLTAYWLQSLQ